MKKSKLFTTLLMITLSLSLFAVTAFASGGTTVPPPVPEEEKMPVSVPDALTPDGNLTLVDDIQGAQSGDKQFITMQSKNGNYFYLVIDRGGDKENVYFLNLVDEADLMALIEETPVDPQAPAFCDCSVKCQSGDINADCSLCDVDKNVCKGKVQPTEPQPEPEETTISVPLLILMVAVLGGGGFFALKIKKSKTTKKGTSNLDEYDFDDGEDDCYIQGDDILENEITDDESEDDDL